MIAYLSDQLCCESRIIELVFGEIMKSLTFWKKKEPDNSITPCLLLPFQSFMGASQFKKILGLVTYFMFNASHEDSLLKNTKIYITICYDPWVGLFSDFK